MKRSDFFIRLISGVLFLAVACYIGVYLYNAFVNPYTVTSAIRYSIEGSLSAEGFIVRTEMVLDDEGSSVIPVVAEGEKVASGQAIGVEYLSVDALETAAEIRSLRLKITQLESARGSNDSARFNAVLDLSHAVNSYDFKRLDEITLNVETTIFTVEEDLSTLKSRLEELESRNIGTRTVVSEESGTFSSVVDGFEHIYPNMLHNLTPAELIEQFEHPGSTYGMGKIITEFKWYYAAVMEHEDASQLSSGQRKMVRFFGTFNAEVEMLIESIGRREDGVCVVLFSSDRGIHDIARLRSLRAEIIYGVISGIRVPKEAIHLDDEGKTFIYLQTSGYAEQVYVEILNPPGEVGEGYLVRDGAETGSPLRVDSIIIVKGNNLYPGKVVP